MICICLLFGVLTGYAAFNTNVNLKAKGNVKTISAGKLGYVTNGLLVMYDYETGIDDGKWLDISGNGKDGILKNFDSIDTSNGLQFDGVDDYVLMGEYNYNNITMQIVFKYDEVKYKDSYNYIFNNFEGGGYGFYSYDEMKKNTFEVCINGNYLMHNTNNSYKNGNGDLMDTIDISKKYFLSGSYDSKMVVFYENNKRYFIEKVGTTCFPSENTYLIIGGNPEGSILDEWAGKFKGKVYSVRFYDRALSDDEVIQNFNIDKMRFDLED